MTAGDPQDPATLSGAASSLAAEAEPGNAPLAAAEAGPGTTGDLPEEAVLRRAEDKPPLYRFFRGGIYFAYMVVVVWFVLSICVAAWRAIWGEPGDALRAGQSVAQPLQATPDPTNH